MSHRILIGIARMIWALSILLGLLLLLLVQLNGESRDQLWGQVWIIVFTMAYPIVGMLIVKRHPHNAISWLFLMVMTFFVGAVANEYARYAVITHPGTLPGGVLVGWIGSWIYRPGFCALLLFLPLLFPTGRPLSPRWRRFLWFSVGLMVVFTLLGMFKPSLDDPLNRYVVNPFGIGRPGGLLDQLDDSLGLPLLFGLSFVAFASSVLRFKRARGVERQQLKWLVYAVAVMLACVLGISFASDLVPGLPAWFGDALFAFLLSALPITTGIAILQYRLFDIDIIINRTLVYSALTLMLGLIYIGCIVLLQALVVPLLGSSDLAIVGATLAITALFFPLRQRIQDVIDKRFYRRKYDGAKVLAAFGAATRDEPDLEALTGELLRVVDETMQPEFVGLWLPDTPMRACNEVDGVRKR